LRLADALQPAALQLHGDESSSLVRQLKARGLTVWAACSSDGEADSSVADERVERRACALTGAGAGADAILIDAARAANESGGVYGGTGKLSDWRLAHSLVEDDLRVVLAGGLSPDNVADAVHAVRPWMVDVISGVEARKGVKDEEKVRRFIEAARGVPH
jgi:phosphoribosylanthranilate isomerase